MRPLTRFGLAVLGFAGLHSALASQAAKRAAARVVGERTCAGAYRAAFVAQSAVTFSALLAYGAGMPRHTLYRVSGPAAWLLRAGQAAGVLHLLLGLREVGVARWSGARNLRAWLQGGPIPPGPMAQGPEMNEAGQLEIGRLFLTSRHPLNFSGVPIFWLTPHMTTRRLLFNLLGTAYFFIGSRHEEARLRAGYGAVYQDYAARPIPFLVPRPRRIELR